ncbi:hypothetical protein [Limihaloglobus sulfuriphilus]|nr:hypothetical protein [Limihaloglobus sulfuriphilus]
MSYNAANRLYQAFIEDVPATTQIQYNCGEGQQVLEQTIYERWSVRWQLDRPAMRSIENNILLETYEYDFSRNRINAQECNYTLDGIPGAFTGRNTTFPVNFNESGEVELIFDCNYTISGDMIWPDNITVVEFEPQLTEIAPPFGQVTASDFKLGNYDFNLDGYDDLIVLGDDLRIYAGPDYNTVSYQNTDFDSDYDFVVSDVDSDGNGDILLGKLNIETETNITLLTFENSFSFSSSILHTNQFIRAFGPVNFNNDFDRDILIISGDGNVNLSYLIGPELTASNEFEIIQDCDDFHILDINKDFKEDLICLRDFSGFGYTRLSIMLNDGYEDASFSSFSYNLHDIVDSKILIANLDDDEQYEIAVTASNITVYDVNFSDETLHKKTSMADVFMLWAIGSGDSTNTNMPELLALYYDGDTSPADNSLGVFYDNLTSEYSVNSTTFFNSLAYIDIDGDSDTDILTGHQTGDRDITLWNNSIDIYVENNLSHSFSISIADASEGVVNESVSDQAAFTLMANAAWSVADHFIHAEFATHEFRNDVFDSRLNRKYYLTNSDGNYTFNTSNYDEYTVSVWPVTYAGILASPITASKLNSECVYVPGNNWIIDVFCSGYSGDNWKYFDLNTSSFIASNTQVEWNHVNATGNSYLFNHTTDTITNSLFNNISNLSFVGNTNRLLDNITFSDVNISITNASLNISDSSFEDCSIIAQDAVLYLEDTSLPSSISLRSSSSFEVYSLTNISFTDGQNPVYRSGTFNNSLEETSFSSTSSVKRYWQTRVNNTELNYTFAFDEDFAYLPNSITISNFTRMQVIQLNSTGLPYWDYSVNGSYQTDFRNYSLLNGIEDISGVKLSVGDNLNITLQTSENYSGLNLSSGFYQTANGFNLSLPGTYTVSMIVGSIESPIILKDGSVTTDLSYTSGNVIGTATAGNYEIVNNVSLSVNIPDRSPGNPFDIEVNYTDYFGQNDRSGNCSLAVDGQDSAFSGVVLGEGVYNYLIECDSPDLPYINQSGEIITSNRIVLARYEMDNDAHYSIVIIDGEPTVIMSETSTEDYYAYNQNGVYEDYIRKRESPHPFSWAGRILNTVTNYLITR